MARRKNTIISRLKWDIAILILMIFAGAGYYFLQRPSLRPAIIDSSPGSRPHDRSEGDILLLMPDSPAAPATQFDELDCSYGWYNSLWQDYGSFATALTRNLSPEILAGRSLVIIPRRVAESMPANGIQALKNYTARGGHLIVEHPTENWLPITQIPTVGQPRRAHEITSVEGLDVEGVIAENLVTLPLAGYLLPATKLPHYPNGPLLVEVDGQPGITVHSVEQGFVYSLLFDFGCTYAAMTQGLPTDGIHFATSSTKNYAPTSQRRLDPRMETSHIPYAELLKRAVFKHSNAQRPMPSLWRFPQDFSGSLIVSLPTKTNTEATLGYADWARQRQGIATAFIASDQLNSAQAAILNQSQADLGLTWIFGRTRNHISDSVGIGPLRPIARELTLFQQAAQLQRHSSNHSNIRLVHTEDSLWLNDWATTFKQLAHARLRVDSSFGPYGADQYGYLFGTGLPYYPIDEQGLPIPILELPYVLRGASITPSQLRRFLINSESYFHQNIQLMIPSDTMLHTPSANLLKTLDTAFELADEYSHWVTTVGEFVDYMTARRRSILTSQWNLSEHRLTISVNLAGARVKTLDNQSAIPSVAIPAYYQGNTITMLEIDDKKTSINRLKIIKFGDMKLLELPAGRHTISITYANAPSTHAIE